MPLFQQSLLEDKLLNQDQELVLKGYKKFKKYFHNTTIQENIRNIKRRRVSTKDFDGAFCQNARNSIND